MTTSSGIRQIDNRENKQKFNRTAKKHKNKTQPRSFVKPAHTKRAAPTKEYLCKACDSQVLKQHPCGSEIVPATKHHPAKTAGLGKFKCSCGHNKVYVKKVKAAAETELKKAA